MSLYPPKSTFSDADKRLLALMAKLLVEPADEAVGGSNLPPDSVSLTDAEAEELASGLDQIVTSPKFIEAAYFVEAVTHPNEQQSAREIYLSARQRNGRSRTLASTLWADFQSRLGIHIPPSDFRVSRPMAYGYFERMERRLLLAAGLNPRVVEIVMKTMAQQKAAVELIRSSERRLAHGIIKQTTVDPIVNWIKHSSALPERTMPLEKIVGTMIVVADMSVLFTTRDWSVAGTLSTIAGGLTSMALH